jgi:protein CpxP
MNYFDKSRILVIMITLLVILNLATLSFLWINRSPHPERRGGDAPAQYLIEQVGLTPDQQAAYRVLIRDHQGRMHSIHDSIRFHKIQLFRNLQGIDSTAAKVESATIGRFQETLEMNTFNHFLKVRALCSPVQAIKFDKVIDDVLRMMAPPGPRPR